MCYRPSHVCYRERNDNQVFIQIAFVESLVGPHILIFVFSASKIVSAGGYEKDLWGTFQMRSAAFKTTEYETCPKKQLIITVSYLSLRRAYKLWSSVRMIESCVKILTSDCY